MTPTAIDSLGVDTRQEVLSYKALTPESAAHHARAERVIAGGTSRQAGHWRPYPLTIARAQGPYLFDLDDRRYIDLTNNYTSLVHGHGYEPIVEVVRQQLSRGTAWSANNPAQVELAEEIVRRIPGMDRVRFTNSGTEAGNLALMIAREITGRNKLLMARYGYHGGLMEFEVGSFDLQGTATHVATYNDAGDFERVLAEHGDEIAAVFVEPVMGAGGVIVAGQEFLRRVAAATRRAGALFVLDEVITFRFALGGRQGELGIEPDLTMLGKLVGGGFPVGAVGGKAEHFRLFEPENLKVWHSGTFNANPITMAAGTVAVRHLTQTRIDSMARQAEKLDLGLRQAAGKLGLPFSINRYGSILNVFFMDTPPAATLLRADQDLISSFHIAAMNHGVFIAARGMMALSTVISDAMIGEIIERLALAMKDIATG